jgi:hypothetical protein
MGELQSTTVVLEYQWFWVSSTEMNVGNLSGVENKRLIFKPVERTRNDIAVVASEAFEFTVIYKCGSWVRNSG